MGVKHSPGPWTACHTTYDGKTCGFHIAATPFGSADPVCETRALSGRPSEELEANAQLIAAAPDLLGALKQARAFVAADLRSTLECVCVLDKETLEPILETLDPEEVHHVERIREVLSVVDAALAKAESATPTERGR